MSLNYWSKKISKKIIKICINYELKICMSLAVINILLPSILDKGDHFTFIRIMQYIHMYKLKFPLNVGVPFLTYLYLRNARN